MRADMAAGRLQVRIEDGSFVLADHLRFLEQNADSIAEFRARQGTAFSAERAAWEAAGEFDPRPEPVAVSTGGAVDVPDGGTLVQAPVSGSVWQVHVVPGDSASAGERLLTLEAMKMETTVEAPVAGEVLEVLVSTGDQVHAGAPVLILGPRTKG
jgi:urea carboxylase